MSTPRPEPFDRGQFLSRLLVMLIVLVSGTAALRTLWIGWGAFPGLLLAGLLGLAAAIGVRRLRLSYAVGVLAVVAVPLIVMVMMGRARGLGLGEAFTEPVPRLLTSPFPAQLTPELLLPGWLVAWAAGAAGGMGIFRKRYFVEPLLSGLILFVAAELGSAGLSDWETRGVLALVFVTALLTHWSGWTHRVRQGLQRASGLAAVLGLVALAVGFVPLGRPFQPRDLIQNQAQTAQEANPLPMVSAWGRKPEVEILRRSGDDFPLHLAVLPEYDGVSWGSESRYAAMGGTQRPLLPPGKYQKTLTTSVTWTPDTRWLPAPGTPTSVTIPDAKIDIDTGTLMLPELPNGVVSYTVTGSVDAPRLVELEAADVGKEPRYTRLPDLPPAFEAYARKSVEGTHTYLGQAQALERALKTERRFNPYAPTGSSVGRLSTFLFETKGPGAREGSSEQFATSYALLARTLNMPSRVVVGFGPGDPAPGDPTSHVVRGRHALAWPEIYFAEYGWVAFNPTPDLMEVPKAGEQVKKKDAPKGRTEGPAEGKAAPPSLPPDPPPPPPPAQPPAPWWLLLVLIGALAAARLVRRGVQRRRGTLGSWQLVEDALRLAGQAYDPSRPASTRAAASGVEQAAHVARMAETDSFAPSAPPALDDLAWTMAKQADAGLRRRASWWRRAVWWLTPLVFLPRTRRGRSEGTRRPPGMRRAAKRSAEREAERV